MKGLHPTLVASHLNAYFNKGNVKDMVDINDVELSFKVKTLDIAPAVAVMLAKKFYDSTAKNKQPDFQQELALWSENTSYWVDWENWDEDKLRGYLIVYTRYSETRFKIHFVDGEYEIKAHLGLVGTSSVLDDSSSVAKQRYYGDCLQQYRNYKLKYRNGVPQSKLDKAAEELFKEGISRYYNSLSKKSSGYLGVCYDKDKRAEYLHERLVSVTDNLGAYNVRASNGVSGSDALQHLKTNTEYIESMETNFASDDGKGVVYIVQSKKLGVRFKMALKTNKETGSTSFYLLDMLFRQ